MSEPTASDLLKEKVFAAYQSRKFTAIWDIVQAQMRINIAAETRAGDMELEIARLTTLVAEGERREKLLREWVIARKAVVYATATTWHDAEMRWRAAEDALQDAGFTPDGWTEDQP